MASQPQPDAAQQQPQQLKPPQPPGPEDCCQNGCKVCVWDMYRADLKEYNERLAATDPGAPPAQEAPQSAAMAASLDAFEQMERQLAAQARAREWKERQRRQGRQQGRPQQEGPEGEAATAGGAGAE
ncbi:hypothetical protein Rsub_13033 [Raphidocelis subcapitata]|uniref:Oxidoreductase-like domain-containing protein n=1 Tax=Raphidocelis subcapitata TaxID=307507 RepID=A0A2V0PKK1_9CHLO|nr:hypothetical protein Rsub_13033 [Raphidocelis subcapitata]|eukprot:GBG00325.1 hypothetical protein Rsub_13033 [Raphidocelis subcapitata]